MDYRIVSIKCGTQGTEVFGSMTIEAARRFRYGRAPVPPCPVCRTQCGGHIGLVGRQHQGGLWLHRDGDDGGEWSPPTDS